MMEITLLMVTCIALIRTSYTDWLNKVVEVPITLYVTGFVTAAYLFSQRYWEFFFFTIFFILAWAIAKPYFENKKLIGAGDISVLSFVIPVTWFINPYLTPTFLFLFALTTLAWYRKELTTKTEKPMIPIITIALLLTWIIGKLLGLSL
jgi:hypothetical protein